MVVDAVVFSWSFCRGVVGVDLDHQKNHHENKKAIESVPWSFFENEHKKYKKGAGGNDVKV